MTYSLSAEQFVPAHSLMTGDVIEAETLLGTTEEFVILDRTPALQQEIHRLVRVAAVHRKSYSKTYDGFASLQEFQFDQLVFVKAHLY